MDLDIRARRQIADALYDAGYEAPQVLEALRAIENSTDLQEQVDNERKLGDEERGKLVAAMNRIAELEAQVEAHLSLAHL